MLDRCDRVQIAVHDAAKAAQRFSQLLGCQIARRDHSRHLARQAHHPRGRRERVRALRARRRGPRPRISSAKRGEGLMTAGYCTADLDRMVKRWEGLGVPYDRDGEQLYLGAGRHLRPADRDLGEHLPAAGRAGVVPLRDDQHAGERLAPRRRGLCRPVRPRSDALQRDRQRALRLYRHAHPVRSAQPARSHRIEPGHRQRPCRWAASPTSTATRSTCATSRSMTGRAVRGRLLDANARYTPRGSDPVTDPDGGWVHPKELHGLLLGVSRTGARLGVVGPRGSGAAGMKHEASFVLLSCWRRADARAGASRRVADRRRRATCASGWRCRRRPAKTTAAEKEKGHAGGARRLGVQARRARSSTSTMSTTSPAGSPSRDSKEMAARARPRRSREGVPARQVQVRARRADHPAGLGRLRARHRGRRTAPA